MERDFNYKSIADILRSPARQIIKLNKKIEKLQILNNILQNIIPENLYEHCRVANFNNYVLTLVVENCAWATHFRMLSADIMLLLKKHSTFFTLNKINFLIDFNFKSIKSQNTLVAPILSKDTQTLIKNSVAAFNDVKLKEVFLKLSGS